MKIFEIRITAVEDDNDMATMEYVTKDDTTTADDIMEMLNLE